MACFLGPGAPTQLALTFSHSRPLLPHLEVKPRGHGSWSSRASPSSLLPHRVRAEELLAHPQPSDLDPSMQAPPCSHPSGLSLDDFIPEQLRNHVGPFSRGTRVSETARERVTNGP